MRFKHEILKITQADTPSYHLVFVGWMNVLLSYLVLCEQMGFCFNYWIQAFDPFECERVATWFNSQCQQRPTPLCWESICLQIFALPSLFMKTMKYLDFARSDRNDQLRPIISFYELILWEGTIPMRHIVSTLFRSKRNHSLSNNQCLICDFVCYRPLFAQTCLKFHLIRWSLFCLACAKVGISAFSKSVHLSIMWSRQIWKIERN